MKLDPIKSLSITFLILSLTGCGGGGDEEPTTNESDTPSDANSATSTLTSKLWLTSECLLNAGNNYIEGLYQFTSDGQILYGYQKFQDTSCSTPEEQITPNYFVGSYQILSEETLHDGTYGLKIQVDIDDNSYVGYLSQTEQDKFCTSENILFSTIGLYYDVNAASSINYENCISGYSLVNDQDDSDTETDNDSGIPTSRISAPSQPSDLKELRGVIVMGIQPGGMFGLTEEFIALFNDGTYTDDLKTVFTHNPEVSKQENPSSWGQWQIRGSDNELLLKDSDDTSFDDTRGNWIARPATNGEALSGCFGRLTSSGDAYDSDTIVGLAQTWCFWENGRFTNSSTAFGHSTSGVDVNMLSISPKARGRYYVDNYTIRLIYDDMHEIQAAFCFANEEKDHITLNGKRFMGGSD
ncbi:MAG: hypothetical protein ABW157_00515 [Candidatus Thiodiazotropha sp. LLP2]